jgi:hypothetical protein
MNGYAFIELINVTNETLKRIIVKAIIASSKQ